jgi:DNA-binding beta-propeller fold protein YncE
VAVSPDSRYVYVASRQDNAVSVFRVDREGRLTSVQVVRQGHGGVRGLVGPTGLALSPLGERLFASAAGSDSVAVFERDAASGQLRFTEAVFDRESGSDGALTAPGLDGVSAVATSRDGRYLYATGQLDGALVVFLEGGEPGESGADGGGGGEPAGGGSQGGEGTRGPTVGGPGGEPAGEPAGERGR